jgi:hypothetical protein
MIQPMLRALDISPKDENIHYIWLLQVFRVQAGIFSQSKRRAVELRVRQFHTARLPAEMHKV